MRWAALAWGDPAAPPALLLHGYPDTAWTWRRVGPMVAAAGWRAVAPFMPGYAPTDPAPGGRYLIADLVHAVCTLHDRLGGDPRAVVVGHDWGAVIVWALSTHRPERFARLVALSVPPPATLLAVWRSPATLGLAGRQLRMSWHLLYNQLPGAEHTLARVIPRLWRQWSADHQAAEDLARVTCALPNAERRRAALAYYRHNLRGGLRDTLGLRAGSAPVLYLHGERDGCLSIELARLAAPMLAPGGRLEVLPDVGHFPQLESPELTGALICAHLGRR